jgi:hypothetical protein
MEQIVYTLSLLHCLLHLVSELFSSCYQMQQGRIWSRNYKSPSSSSSSSSSDRFKIDILVYWLSCHSCQSTFLFTILHTILHTINSCKNIRFCKKLYFCKNIYFCNNTINTFEKIYTFAKKKILPKRSIVPKYQIFNI